MGKNSFPIIRIGDYVKAVHMEKDKVKDSMLYYLNDLSVWKNKQTITKIEFFTVPIKEGTLIKPKYTLQDNDQVILRNGKAFGYFRVYVRTLYEKPHEIHSVHFIKLLSPQPTRRIT